MCCNVKINAKGEESPIVVARRYINSQSSERLLLHKICKTNLSLINY